MSVSDRDVVGEIEAKLLRYPQIRHSRIDAGAGLRIEAMDDGFSISLLAERPAEWVAQLGDEGFHVPALSDDEALDMVGFCLSDVCRLRVH